MHHARRSRPDSLRPKLIALSVAACFSLSAAESLANPAGASGDPKTFSISQNGGTLTITNSANAIINWQSFSIGVGEITRFLQSSAASAVLNRVIGAADSNGRIVIPQSVIDGILSSNGRVFLLNPSGVLISKTGSINVAGLVMSSLNLSDQDFINGRMHFTELPGAGGIVNNGMITAASGGRVFLVGPDVQNVGDGVKTGVISAPNGQIVLAAGKSVDLVSEDSPFVTVKVTADSEQALNLGALIADSGRIDMSGALVRNAGVVAANSAVAGANGEIRLVATKDLTLDAGSRTTANGPSGGDVLLQAQTGTNLISGAVEAKGSSGTGGTVQALGVRVGVIGNGVIDASGDTGGGTVLVGGDAHGANPNVQNAQQALIGPDGVIRADAGTTGDGGRVVVWSDNYTQFYGNISARGGNQSGNGGSVETSGANLSVGAHARVDTSAPKGTFGSWLLDPTDINIVPSDPGDGSYTTDLSTVATFAYGDIGTLNTSIDVNSIDGSFGTVTLQATHDINFNTSVSIAYGGAGLIAQAGNNIALNSNNIATNGGAVSLTANDPGGATSGTGSITSNSGFGNISTNGGAITLSGFAVTVGNLNTSGPADGSVANGNVNISTPTNGGDITTGSITTLALSSFWGGGSVNLSTDTGNIFVKGPITTHGADGSTVGQSNPYDASSGGGVFITRGSLTTAGTVSVAGDIQTYGGNGATVTDPQSPFYGEGGFGGSGGSIQIVGPNFNPINGDVSVGNIDTHGGSGANALASLAQAGGDSGTGGSVDILASSTIAIRSITTSGGNGGNGGSATGLVFAGRGADGSEGGHIDLEATGSVGVAGDINMSAGRGGAGGDSDTAGYGGLGGSSNNFSSLFITGSTISAGTISASGADGGNGGANGGFGGAGGRGTSVQLIATSGSVGVTTISTSGGAGGSGGFVNSGGGTGGTVSIGSINGDVTVGSITASGGAGGSASVSGTGGSGGNGGAVALAAISNTGGVGGTITAGPITSLGGDGGSGAPDAGNGGGSGGNGGSGGSVGVNNFSPVGNLGNVDVAGPPPSSPVALVFGTVALGNIDTSGGNAGAGGKGIGSLSLAGDGGTGGNAGGVAVFGGKIDLTKGGTIVAMGGNGGAGGNGDPGNGGAGGAAGSVSLSSTSTILVLKPLVINGMTFASTPLTTTSVAGGTGGAAGVDITGAMGIAGAIGGTGTISINGQIVIVDPLSIPEVSQNYNTLNDSTNKSTGSLNADDQKKKDEDNKKGAAVCK